MKTIPRFAALILIPCLLADAGIASGPVPTCLQRLENSPRRAGLPEFGSQALTLSLTWAHRGLTDGFLRMVQMRGGVPVEGPARRKAEFAGVAGIMPPSILGLQTDAVLFWSPALEEMARAFIWGNAENSWALIFSAALILAHWFRYRFIAREIYADRRMPAMKGFPPFWYSIFGRWIYVLVSTMFFSAVMAGLAFEVFYLGRGEPKARDFWWIDGGINFFLHFVAGLVWKIVFEERVRLAESAVMPASLWGTGARLVGRSG